MKAVICTSYGPPDVLQLRDIPKPVPKDNEILVKIHATSVTAGDVRIRGFRVPAGQWLLVRLALGFTRPKNPILGVELAGEVEAAGKDVTRFRQGDHVFGTPPWMVFGTYAEYLCLPETAVLAQKPPELTWEEAAGVPFMALGALHFLRKADVRRGKKILVYGASGSLGTNAVQLARHFGAEVTGVCSTANLGMVKSLGAATVIDYTAEDFTKNGEVYDVIFDAVGKTTFSRCKKSLKPGGFYIDVNGGITQLLRMFWTSRFGSRKIIAGTATGNADDLAFIKALLEKGELRPVIDRQYPLEEIVEAHRYVDKGHKKGSVVITVNE